MRMLPSHPHLVSALDIFLDPLTRKLHICMEYMEGNLYQLMKARDRRPLDGKQVKNILYQILSGLDHIHANRFFHRDIKPENILISASSSSDSALSRYSNLVTPPSTPSNFNVKIADFGLAREMHSRQPYTTYVSTRWYRAPEVLLRAGEYSAPVDIWAVGAMAVEVATLKPLFPGGNEVDQVWRVCEVMGSPGSWYSKSGAKVGGGEWKDGTRLAHRLGFTFPKMAPHAMESILNPSYWPASLSNLVTWCLMWDPKNRPTTAQALNHEYFSDAVDPLLRPRSSTSRLLGKKQSDRSFKSKESGDYPTLTSKPSWFRRSLISKADTPITSIEFDQCLGPNATNNDQSKSKSVGKRATWATGAPMPILPSIRPVSPLSNAVTAQAKSTTVARGARGDAERTSKKIGRQLSVNSQGNHYADVNRQDVHRQEAEKALTGGNNNNAAASTTKEGFFSHLRKRTRRFSGRNSVIIGGDGSEAGAGCMPWSNRSSLVLDASNSGDERHAEAAELDNVLRSVRSTLDASAPGNVPIHLTSPAESTHRRSLLPQGSVRSFSDGSGPINVPKRPASGRTRRAMQMTGHPVHRYETPEEEDELLDEALRSADAAARSLAEGCDRSRPLPSPYPTPSPSAKCGSAYFGGQYNDTPGKRTPDTKTQWNNPVRQWPTPPYEEDEWAKTTSARLFAAGS